MITLQDYQNLIDLTPQTKSTVVLSAPEKAATLEQLLKIIRQKFDVPINLAADYHQQRLGLRAILNQLPPCDLGAEFYQLQDRLLSSETNEKTVIHPHDLTFRNQIALYQGDITTLAVDAIVNAGNSQLLGCFVPLHACIDNIIISAAGFQVRNDLHSIMQKQTHPEPNGHAKITRAYNLPSQYIIHTVGPYVAGTPTAVNRQDLANCYRSALDLAQAMHLQSVAFCCIATGEFHFPHALACDIAVSTVQDWLKTHPSDMQIIFNVFKDIDKEEYEKRLSHPH